MIQKSKLGVLSIVAVAMLLMVALVPVIASEDSNAASEGGTIYLQPGDTYTWAPTFNISTDRLTLTVLASSTNTTTGTYASTSTSAPITAEVQADKKVKISVDSSATTASTTYVTVKAVVTKGATQTTTQTSTIKVFVPAITNATVNTYQGGTVTITPTITGVDSSSIGSASITYSATGLPDGLSINATNAKITGTVSSSEEAKTYTVKIVGTISTTPEQNFSGTFNIVVAGDMTLTAPGDQYIAKGTAKDITLTGTNTTSTTTWAITSTAVSGITMSTATGTSGKITVANTTAVGSYTVEYKATNPTSKQSVTGSVKIVVGNVTIDSIVKGAESYTEGISSGKITLYTVTGTAASFNVTATSNPTTEGLGLTLSATGTDAGKVSFNGQTIQVANNVAAGTYTFTLVDTQAKTGADASVSVTLIVDPVLEFNNSITTGGVHVKGSDKV